MIGVTLDSEPAGGYAKLPWYALRENYCDVVAAAGGLPMALPHEPDLAEHYLALIDGLVVTGGAFDVDPALYGGGERHAHGDAQGAAHPVRVGDDPGCRRARQAGARHLRRPAAAQRRPGRHADPAHPRRRAGRPRPRAAQPAHRARPRGQRSLAGSLLHRITGADSLPVNSAHHQAAERVGAGIVVSATAPDGVIEAIEDPRRRFCLGVQWHPEYGISPGDTALIEAFVRAAACR